MSDENITIEKAEGTTCLFTKQDWQDWEEIEERTKSRGPKYKAGHMSYTYPKVKCILCKRIISITHLRRHRQAYHYKEFAGVGWYGIPEYEEKCYQAYKDLATNKTVL